MKTRCMHHLADRLVHVLCLPGVLDQGVPAVQVIGHHLAYSYLYLVPYCVATPHPHGVRVPAWTGRGVVSLAELGPGDHRRVGRGLGLGSLHPARRVVGPACVTCHDSHVSRATCVLTGPRSSSCTGWCTGTAAGTPQRSPWTRSARQRGHCPGSPR